jgi:hypothetical protein
MVMLSDGVDACAVDSSLDVVFELQKEVNSHVLAVVL